MKNLDRETVKIFGDQLTYFDKSRETGLERIKFKNNIPFWKVVGFGKN